MKKIIFEDGDKLFARQLNKLQDNTEEALNNYEPIKKLYQHNLVYKANDEFDTPYYIHVTVYDDYSGKFADNGSIDSSYTNYLFNHNGIHDAIASGFYNVYNYPSIATTITVTFNPQTSEISTVLSGVKIDYDSGDLAPWELGDNDEVELYNDNVVRIY